MAEEGYEVRLNVYDLSQGLARQMSSTFLGKVIEGIWHTGVVVYGNEYYFGGGLQSCPQGQTPYGKPLRVLELGTTQLPKEVFEEYLQEISPRYTEQTYNLLNHNCNNFCDEVVQFLLGVRIPEYILKLPEEVMSSPMGALLLPMIQQFETILRYGGVPQVPHAIGGEALNLNQTPVSAVPSTLSGASSFREQPLPMASGSSSVKMSGSQDAVPPAVAPDTPKSATSEVAEKVVDRLGDARARVQEEITREFAALMAEGRLRASEAAALAARRVMERHGRGAGVAQKS